MYFKCFDFSISDFRYCDAWFRDFRRVDVLISKCDRVLSVIESGVGNDPEFHVRVDFVDVSYWSAIRRRLLLMRASRLDVIYVIPERLVSDPCWFDDAAFLDRVSSELRFFFRRSNVSLVEMALIRQLKEGARSARVSEYRSRLICELRDAAVYGRFVVFWTLSVDDRSMASVFGVGSRCFESFIEGLKTACGDGYFSYFAVPELGGKTGRPHYHMLMVCDSLPDGCVDPNAVRGAFGYRREVSFLKRFWRFGLVCEPVAVRSPGDRFSLEGWFWPSEKGKPGVPVKSSYARTARYLVKYVTKEKDELWEKVKLKCRVRMSRRFGLARVRARLALMSDREVMASALLCAKELNCGRLVKREARREACRRLIERERSGSESLKILRDVELKLSPRTSLYQRLLSSMRGIRSRSVESVTRYAAYVGGRRVV